MPVRMIKVAVFYVFLFECLLLEGQSPYTEYQLKAAYIEKFTHFIRWPNLPAGGENPRFRITILGEDPFGRYIDELFRTVAVKAMPVEIRRIRKIEELDSTHILFICRSEKDRLKRILERVRHRPILTIGDTPGYAEAGVILNLFKKDNYIRFEANLTAIADSGLEVNSRLLKLAKIVGTVEK